MGCSYGEFLETTEASRQLANQVAIAHFNKDQAFRFWAASHGGVYVPTNDRTLPSPYLGHIPERDLQTPSGKRLTLMNPAYMLRQLHEDFAGLYGVKGHLTSLRPLRPENSPDDWEKNALEAFEQGKGEVIEYAEVDGKPCLRLIGPLVAAKDCLKCHSGYKEGDIRGGIGIALPLENFGEAMRTEIETQIVSHGSIFVLGLVGIVLGARRLERHERERDQAQEELQASERKYRMLFDESMDGVFITSPKGSLIEANQSLLDMFGYTAEEVAAIDVRQLYRDPRDRDRFKEVIKHTGSVKDYQLSCRKKDGKPIDCVFSANVRMDEDGSVIGYQGIVRDITEKRKAEVALKNQAKELERSNADLEQFAYVASHDLQEPLRNVKSCLELLEKKYKNNLDAKADQYIHYAVESSARMKALIQDLLTYSRVGTRGKPPKQIDCEQILDQTVKNLRSSIADTGAVITHDPLPNIFADDTQLLQVFQNLIGNAIKFRGDEPQVHVCAVKKRERMDLFSQRQWHRNWVPAFRANLRDLPAAA